MNQNHPFKALNSNGQIAIFIALIFQVLFVFFAMVINVGLLVHQKINLQNSVDLAAYYGAMKQAEGLNAVAHMNYQIRQSWKLMSWRAVQMGTAGEVSRHPYKFVQNTFMADADNDNLMYDAFPAYCQGYPPVDIYANDENYCKNLPGPGPNGSIDIPVPSVSTPFVSGFFTFAVAIANATKALGAAAQKGCAKVGGTNWFSLARYVAAWKMDTANRKQMVYLVANGMSKSTGDLLDVGGESVREGVIKTLKKNLSPENRDTASLKDSDIEFYNSLGDPNCGFVDEKSPPKWLSEISIAPTFYYMETQCTNGSENADNTKFFIQPLAQFGAPTTPLHPQGFETVQDYLSQRVSEPDGATPQGRLYKASLGFEKNPWCMAYVGVSAKTSPQIPFSPFGRLTMTAKAFAKPFGGRVGPWYGKKWSDPKSLKSDNAPKVDPLVPQRMNVGQFPDPATQATVISDVNLSPNYSRYPGDVAGVRSKLTTGRMSQSIHTRGPISLAWWNQILEEDLNTAGSNGDILAWNKTTDTAPSFRNLEIAAIAPDIFDMTYYSIEPDFYRNYAVRMEARPDRNGLEIRGDYGSRKLSTDRKIKEFGVKDQVALLRDPANTPFDAQTKLNYFLVDFAHMLTSWQGKNQEDYTIDDTRFGKCGVNGNPADRGIIKDTEGPVAATTGNCRVGGRVGYSVKLVDEQYLRRGDLNIGGDGTSGAINNPVPAGF